MRSQWTRKLFTQIQPSSAEPSFNVHLFKGGFVGSLGPFTLPWHRKVQFIKDSWPISAISGRSPEIGLKSHGKRKRPQVEFGGSSSASLFPLDRSWHVIARDQIAPFSDTPKLDLVDWHSNVGLCMYVCMSICLAVCMYVCLYIYIYVCVYIYNIYVCMFMYVKTRIEYIYMYNV